jgi:hypothetical protein
VELAAARATSLGLGEGGRLLSTTDPTTLEGALTTVLAPLVVGGSLVLLSNPDPGRIDEVAGQEQVDVARARCASAGLPWIGCSPCQYS